MKAEIPSFRIGDTVNVSVRIVEGEKERTQIFTGTVIGRKGSGVQETFTVRRIVNNQGVERVFPIHSPKVAGVEVVRSGKARRAKLYYLRDRIGKSTRLKEVKRPAKPKPSEQATPVEPPEQSDTEAAPEPAAEAESPEGPVEIKE
jgi:large subunit ribosomal protein L19